MSNERVTNTMTRIALIALFLFIMCSYAKAQDIGIANGLNWLVTAQNVDGKWGSVNGIRDTETVVNAFRDLGRIDDSSRKAIDWINTVSIESNDFIARRIKSRAGTGADLSADIQILVSNQNLDGGWGYTADYDSNAHDTAIAVNALQTVHYQNNSVFTNALAYLTAIQNTDGSWSILADVPGDVTTTSLSLLVIKRFSSVGLPVQAGLIGKGVTWLSAKQNTDGGFGSSPSTTYETALALATLLELGQIQTLPLINATNYLKAAQRFNGSWNDNVYDTALALDTLAALNPNLNISATDLSLSTLAPVSGTKVTVTAVVKNSGTGAANNVPVQFLAESSDHQLTQIGQMQVIQSINVGGSTVLLADFDTTGKSGPYNIFVKIDPDANITEITKTDNQASATINIIPLKPDFTLTSSDLTISPAAPKSGETVKIVVNVKNIGTTDAVNVPVQIAAVSADNIQTMLGTPLIPFLPVGGTDTVTLDFNTKGLQGSYTLQVNVDPAGVFDELLITNNLTSKTLSIKAVAELSTTSFALSTNSVNAGEDVKLTTTVSNQGNSSADSIDIAYYVKSVSEENLIGKSTIPTLIPGGSATREFIWKTGLAGTGITVYAVADPKNQIPEVDKNNNLASQLIDIAPVTDANLTLSYRDITFDPPVLKQGQAQIISASIKNTGFTPVDAVNVAFYEGDPQQNGMLIGTATVHSIPAGGTTPVSISWPKIPDNGDKLFFIKIDPSNSVKEFNKDDNETFVSVNILTLPDLQISDNSIVISPAYPKEGDTVSIDVTVLNNGEQNATDVTVQIKEGSTIVGTQTIPVVKANSTATTYIPYDSKGKIGSHQINAIVDPDNKIEELSKVNNSATASFIVQNAKLWISERYFSPNGDGIKDNTQISFRLDAPAKVRVVVVNKLEIIVRTFSGAELDNTAGGSLVWDGLKDSGTVVDDGEYQIRIVDANNTILGSLLVDVDTNRSPLTDAFGTPYLLNNNLTCTLPQYAEMKWLPNESGLILSLNPAEDSPYLEGLYSLSSNGEDIIRLIPDLWNTKTDPDNKYTVQMKDMTQDGQKIALVLRKMEKSKNYGGGWDYSSSLWIVETDGSNLTKAYDFSEPFGPEKIMWSPDGSKIAVMNYGLYIFDPSTKEMKFVAQQGYTFSGQMEWSQDGSMVHAFSYNYAHGFSLSDPSGVGGYYQDQGLSYGGNALGWVWDKKILFSGQDYNSGQTNIVQFDAKNGNFTPLGGVGPDLLTISPDANWIAFKVGDIEWQPGSQSVKVVDAAGVYTIVAENSYDGIMTDQGKVYYSNNGVGSNLQWSKDGSKLGYFNNKYEAASDTFKQELVVYDSAQKTTKNISISSKVCETRAHAAAYGVYSTSCRPQKKVNKIIAWMIDKINMLVDTVEGTFIVNSDSGIMTPVPIDGASPAFSPNERYLTYSRPSDPASTCINKYWGGENSGDVWAMSSLLNLTADLRITKKKSAIILKGIAADKYFEGYKLEYANIHEPANWHLVMPPSDVPVVNDVFATWIPPSDGTFLVQLTVWDKAGNTRIDRKRVSWGISSSVVNIYKSVDLFSPNGDGIKETVELHYTILEPVHLEFTIVDEYNKIVRTFLKDYSAAGTDFITWDGRDDSGQMVDDGKYVIKLFDYEFPLEVDRTAPLTTFKNGPYSIKIEDCPPLVSCPPPVPFIVSNISVSVLDRHLKRWNLEYGLGDNPTEWIEYAKGDAGSFKTDAAGNRVGVFVKEYKDNEIQWLLNKMFRLTTEDIGGITTQTFSQFDQETILINQFDGIGVSKYAPSSSLGSHTMNYVYFIKKPIDKIFVQYETGKDIWRDELVDKDKGFVTINLKLDVSAVRIKALDTNGKIILSNSIIVRPNDGFYISMDCVYGPAATIQLSENLTELKLQLKTSTDTWVDYKTMNGNAVPSNGFDLKIPAPPGPGFIRMIGIDAEGMIFTSPETQYPRVCNDEVVKIKNMVEYEKVSECGEGPTKAVVSAMLDTDAPISPVSIQFHIMRNSAWELLKEFDLTKLDLSAIKIPFDLTTMAEGEYPIKLVFKYKNLMGNYEKTIENNHSGMLDHDPWLRADLKPPAIQFNYPAAVEMVCPVREYTIETGEWFGVTANAIAEDNFGWTFFEMFYGDGENPQEWIKARSRSADISSGKVEYPVIAWFGPHGEIEPWDVTSLPSGSYSLKLKVYDAVGNISCKTTSFTLEKASIIQSLKIDKSIFSPNGDGFMDDARIDYAIDRNASIESKVFRLIYDADGLPQLDTIPIRTIVTGKSYFSGIDSIVWDGKGDAGAVLPDGKYGIALYATNSCGVTSTKWIPVEIDSTPPLANMSYPNPALSLPPGNFIEIIGTVDDVHFSGYTIEAGEGVNPVVWSKLISRNAAINNDVLGVWNTYGLMGMWAVRLTAVDSVGNRAIKNVTLNMDNRMTLVKSLAVVPDFISPNNDQKSDSTFVKYEITEPSRINIKVFDSSSVSVREFSFNAPSSGMYMWNWDGKSASGAVVSDGTYKIKLEAALSSNLLVRQDEVVSIVVDSTNPKVDIKQPDKSYLNKTAIVVSGEISDKNLSEYSISYSGPDGAFTLDSGNQNRVSHVFGTISELKEDTYTLTVDAKDLAENSNRVTRVITIDRTPPKVTLHQPKKDEFFGNAKKVIDFTGAIIEKNLDQYIIRYGMGDTPDKWVELKTANVIPAVPIINSWKVGLDDGVPDGMYTLSVYAKDKVGLEGEVKTKITIDNTPPEVTITSPKNGDYVKGAFGISGSVSDLNLDKASLELSDGNCTAAFKWSTVKSYTTSIKDGLLDSWKLLPSDGEYCLRLSATDKSGNKAETKISIKIDTKPPVAPQLTGEIDSKVDAVLTWSKNTETDLAGYNLYRNNQKLNTASLATMTYRDPSLKEGSYIYTVKAVDIAGNESAPSNTVALKIDISGPTVQVSTPKDGSAISNLVDVKGTAYSQDDFKEYRVYIGQGSSPSSWTLIRRSPLPISFGSLAQWDTITSQDGAQITIKLEGEDTSGNISTTQTIVTIDNTPPKVPVLLTTVASGADVNLTWKANTESDLAGYLLYRNEQLANVKGIVAGNLKPYLVTGTSNTDKALPDGIYSYYLVAMDQAGNTSDQSNTLEVDIDTHPPHMTITAPANGQKFDGKLTIKAETPDNDIATVQFQYKSLQDSTWTNLGLPFNKAPYITYFDPKGINLPVGNYQLRVLVTDRHNNVDPAPQVVTTTYTDLTPPDVPAGLALKVKGADVSLTWSAVSEAGVSYNIYRWTSGTKSKVNSVTVSTVSFVDSTVPDGNYLYEITAMDVAGNESKPSEQVIAKIYAPIITQPFTPLKNPALILEGNGVEPGSPLQITTTLPSGDTSSVTITADSVGTFRLEGITLAPGENRFTAIATDLAGNVSKASDTVVVVYGLSPAAPTGLAAVVNGYDVNLTWNGNSETDIIGYNLFRDGEKVNNAVTVTGGQFSASYQDYYSSPQNAIDGNIGTSWSTPYANGTFSPAWWQMTLPTPEMINRVEIDWKFGSWDDVTKKYFYYAGKDYEIQAWSGYKWITLKKVNANDQQYNTIVISPSYRTDRIRIAISSATDPNYSKYVKISEIRFFKDNLLSSPEYIDMGLSDNRYSYKVSAVNHYGFESDVSSPVEAIVGDLIPPASPTNLQTTVVGSDVILDWSTTPNTESDLDGYYIYRLNRQNLDYLDYVPASATTYTDLSLPNGTYHYRITAYDKVGNESAPSNEVSAIVAIAPPFAPFAPSVISLPEGKALKVSWQNVNSVDYYNVYRGTNSGGPYTRIATRVSSLSYVNFGLVNGVKYFYVITANDALGNESTYSGEANGIPLDLIAQVPTIFQPTISGTPVTVNEASVKVSGFAEPAAQVAVFRDDAQIGSAIALPQDVRMDQSVSISAWRASLSPDGNILAYINSNNYLELLNLQDNSLTSIPTDGRLNSLAKPAWSPSGRYLIMEGYDINWHRKVVLYDRENGVMQPISTGKTSNDSQASWSPKGDSVVFVGDNKNIWQANSTDWKTTWITSVNNYAYYPRLSPDGGRVAFYDDNSTLYVFNRDDNSIALVDDDNDGENCAWSPDSSRLAFISYRDGDGDIYAYDLAGGSITRRTSSQLNGYYITWSPDGAKLGFAHYPVDNDNELYWIVDINGQERKVFEANGDLFAVPEWRTDGALNLIDNQGIHKITPSGFFSLPQVVLVPGENLLSAIEIDEAGNVSNPSDSIKVVFDTGNLPDLTINDRDITFFPPYPKPREDVVVTARVHNPTTNPVDNATVELYLWDGANDVTLLKSEIIPHLDANGEGSVSVRFNAGTTISTRTVIAVADPSNLIQELLETNNYASKDLIVTDQENVTLTSSLNATQYVANQDLYATVKLHNSGLPKTGTLYVAVEDAAGNPVRVLTSQVTELPYGADTTQTFTWNTLTTFSGTYRLHATISDGSTVLAEGITPFSIMPDLKVSAEIVTDRQQYDPRQNVGLTASFKNIGANYIIPLLKARLRILEPHNTELYSGEQTIANLMAGASGSLSYSWNTGLTAPGSYTAALDIFAGDKLVTSTTANFSIIQTVIIGGSIKADPAVAPIGSSFTANYALTNNGNANVSGAAVVSLIDPDTLTVVATSEQAAVIAMGVTVSGTASFSTNDLKLKYYLLKLNFLSQGHSAVIATTPISIKDSTPPVLIVSTLGDGSYTTNNVLNITGLVSDNIGVKNLLINGVSVPLGSDGKFSYALFLKPGANRVEVKATDLADNQASDSRTIILDQKAPILVVTSPADNSKTSKQQVEVTGHVDETSTIEVIINGVLQPVTMDGNNFAASVTLLPGADANTIFITATNLTKKSSSEKRSVYYDDQAPSLAITVPGQDIRTNLADLTIRGTVSDPYGFGVAVSLVMNGQKFTPPLIDGKFEQAVTFTTEDTYNIVATATNDVDTTTNVSRNVIYDITAPAFTIDKVVSPTNQQSQVISGTREVDATVMVSCSTADVGPVEYPSATTWKTFLGGLAVGDNAIIVTATDVAGNPNSLTVRIIYDITPPTGSIVINNGAGFTSSNLVALNLSAADPNGVKRMRLSNDGIAWTEPEFFADLRGWYLLSGDGLKQVFVQYKDAAENWSVDPIVASTVLDMTPPEIAILPAGGIFNTPQTVKLSVNESATIYYTTDGSAPTVLSAVYSSPLTIAASASLNCLAIDNAGNPGTCIENYTIDTIPPKLIVSTLQDGSYTNNDILNITGMITDNTGVKELKVNNVTVPVQPDGSFSHALVLISGLNFINVVATDLAGNPTADNRTVMLDLTAPKLTIRAPNDNIKTNMAFIDVTGDVEDENNTFVEVTLKGIPQTVIRNGKSFTSTVALVPGADPNTINIKAIDLANNSSSDKRSVYYDDKSPALEITVPAKDIRTNQANLTIQGTASDPYGYGVTVSIEMNGQKFTPPLIYGKFEQSVSFTKDDTYKIMATATNEVNTSTSVPRNVIYDTTPPDLSIDPVVSPTTLSSLTITGHREADLIVTVSCTAAVVGEIVYPTTTTWQVQLTNLTLGKNTITTTSVDLANNSRSVSVDIFYQPLAPLVITSNTLPEGAVGVPYSLTLSATGGQQPYVWGLPPGSSLPAGLLLAGDGTINGKPSIATPGSFTVQVKDALNSGTTKQLAIMVNPQLVITTASLADGFVGTSYYQKLAATGGKALYTWSIASGTLPAGLTLNLTTGEIAGIPTAAASEIPVTLQVKDANNITSVIALKITVQKTITDLTARAKPGKADLVWTCVPGNTTTYNIYRGTKAGGPYSLVRSGHVSTYCTYADSGLTNGTTYYWRVTSVNASGVESPSSNETSAKPTAR